MPYYLTRMSKLCEKRRPTFGRCAERRFNFLHPTESIMVAAPCNSRAEVLTLRSDQRHDSLRDALCESLRDGQPERRSIGSEFVYSRQIPTLVLYTDKGLSIYKEITESKVR